MFDFHNGSHIRSHIAFCKHNFYIPHVLFCSSFRDSTYGEGGDGMHPDDYPSGAHHASGDLNGIETTIDEIFEGISHFFTNYGLKFEVVWIISTVWFS